MDRGKGKSGSLWKFLCDGNTLLDAAATATSLNFIGFNAATLEPHLRQFKLTPLLTGILFVLTGAVYALTSPLMGKLCESGVRQSLLMTTILSLKTNAFSTILENQRKDGLPDRLCPRPDRLRVHRSTSLFGLRTRVVGHHRRPPRHRTGTFGEAGQFFCRCHQPQHPRQKLSGRHVDLWNGLCPLFLLLFCRSFYRTISRWLSTRTFRLSICVHVHPGDGSLNDHLLHRDSCSSSSSETAGKQAATLVSQTMFSNDTCSHLTLICSPRQLFNSC